MPDSSLAPLLAYVAVAAALVITPGVGTASLIWMVTVAGRQAGYRTALGMVAGAAIYAIAAAFGNTALLHAFPHALEWIAIGGGVFISLLGARGVVTAIRAYRPSGGIAAVGSAPERRGRFTTGLLIALGNAPLPLFYLVVVPQYVPKGMDALRGALLLSAIHLLMAGTWMTTLVTILGRLVGVLGQPRVFLTMRLLSGAALIFLGIRSIVSAL